MLTITWAPICAPALITAPALTNTPSASVAAEEMIAPGWQMVSKRAETEFSRFTSDVFATGSLIET